jgi:RNA polymerase sigma-70 factor (ECF subfamily)
MSPLRINGDLAERLYRESGANRWRLPPVAFTATLENSCAKMFSGREPSSRELSRYLASLHLADLALACACAEGHAAAWDHFVLEMRPTLYRAADAIDPTGGARDLADSLYGDLYGLSDRSGPRQSLLRYFHGRSSLATWLRAVLAQRHVDRGRANRRLEPLPDELPQRASEPADPECPGLVDILCTALEVALARLDPRDRLRLACYYAEQLTLAQTGRLLREHEATVSRQLARTRRVVRDEVERELRTRGFNDAQVHRCFECAAEDTGRMDLSEMFAGLPRRSAQAKAGQAGKDSPQDRSI